MYLLSNRSQEIRKANSICQLCGYFLNVCSLVDSFCAEVHLRAPTLSRARDMYVLTNGIMAGQWPQRPRSIVREILSLRRWQLVQFQDLCNHAYAELSGIIWWLCIVKGWGRAGGGRRVAGILAQTPFDDQVIAEEALSYVHALRIGSWDNDNISCYGYPPPPPTIFRSNLDPAPTPRSWLRFPLLPRSRTFPRHEVGK